MSAVTCRGIGFGRHLLFVLAMCAAPIPAAFADGHRGAADVDPANEVITPHFRISYTPKAHTAAKILATQIEQHATTVERVMGRGFRRPIRVAMGYDHDDMAALAPNGTTPPRWAAALAFPDEDLILVDAHQLVGPEGIQTLRHELTHVALGQWGHEWPRWFHEGYAQFMFDEGQFSLDRYTVLARAKTRGRLFAMRDLAASFPELPEDVELAYAQSAAFVRFLDSRHGRPAFQRLIDEVEHGTHFELAFARAFRSSLDVEEVAFLQEVASSYSLWPVYTDGSFLFGVSGVALAVAFVLYRRKVRRQRGVLAEEERAEDAEVARRVAEIMRPPLAENDELIQSPPVPEPSDGEKLIH